MKREHHIKSRDLIRTCRDHGTVNTAAERYLPTADSCIIGLIPQDLDTSSRFLSDVSTGESFIRGEFPGVFARYIMKAMSFLPR
jgi:hypothetical protein